ncbi:MAG: J domain-containing protein [Desulfosporosinus sp.]|nr:J domain-containing protein [Desulfosporosinus sp.]
MNIEELKLVTNLESFKKLGTLSDITKKLNEIVAPLKIEANTNEELYEVFQCLLEKWSDFKKGPFVDERAEYTFYLTMLEGKQRNKMLGITDEMYDSPELAKQWYRRIVKLVHPDTGIDKTNKAFIVLQQLYEVMTDDSEDGLDGK